MIVSITPNRLEGKIDSISSKSDAHRKIICAALADKPTTIYMNNFSDDILATLRCISALGAENKRVDGGVLVCPINQDKGSVSLDFSESGSTARFLLPVCCAMYKNASFTASGRLPERPFYDLINVMKNNGVNFSNDKLPFETKGYLKSGEYTLPGNVSSQYISGLLFALAYLGGGSISLTTQLESQAYVDMTIDTLKSFGADIKRRENRLFVGNQKLVSPGQMSIEGDWSNAAFWIVANKICGNVKVLGLCSESKQGDKTITAILDDTDIDASQIPDLVPILAILATARCGKTVIRASKRLRLKESDRITAMSECINNLGGSAEETEDGLIIHGTGKLRGGTVDSFGDHRVVMAAAIASCISEGKTVILNAEAVTKSYPEFFDDFKKLGGIYECIV